MPAHDPDLFSYQPSAALARRSDPPASHAAAASLEDVLPRLEQAVLAAIRAAGERGATLDEIVSATGIEKVTASPRIRPLIDKGWVGWRLGPSGKPLTRPGKSNRGQTIWWALTPRTAPLGL